MNIYAAKRARDSLTKSFYDHLFRQIVAHINSTSAIDHSNYFIGIFDIAGFGEYENCVKVKFKIINIYFIVYLESRSNCPNTFDQLCINYVNERLQQVFIRHILVHEKEWYDKENLQVPFVPFFDSCDLIGRFVN